jgi:hypothetical protein
LCVKKITEKKIRVLPNPYGDIRPEEQLSNVARTSLIKRRILLTDKALNQ